MLVQVGLEILTGLVNGLSENLPVLIPAIVECLMTIINTLTDPGNIDMLMQAAIQLMIGLGTGLIQAIPVLLENIPQILTNIVEALGTQAIRMYQAASALIDQLAAGIGAFMTSIIPKIKQFVQEKIINPIKEKGMQGLLEAGKNVVEGLWNGINDKFSWIKGKIETWVGNVLKYFKNLLGIHSPSTVFEGYGENMAEGLAIGYMNGIGYIKSALGMTPGLALDAGPAMGGVTLYIDGIKYNTDEYVDSSITNFVESMVRRSQMYGR